MSRLSREQHGEILVLRLDAPDRRNALDLDTMKDLVAALHEAEDGDTRAIVLTGADPAFCAGLDLAEVGSGALVLEDLEGQDADPWLALQRTTTPTIAAVNGAAVTGGLELVLCCDLAIASDRARFADTHARVGIHPSGGLSVLLPRYVGLRDALGMSLTGRFVGADEARSMGLVNEVVEHDELLRAAMATAEAITEADERVLTTLLGTYRELSGVPLQEAYGRERERAFSLGVDADAVESRRAAVIERGKRLAGG